MYAAFMRFLMIDIPESELSQAQADVEPRLSARVNCGPVNDVLQMAIALFQRIFAVTLTLNSRVLP